MEHSAYNLTKNANWLDGIFLRDCSVKHAIEEKIEGMQRREGKVSCCWMVYGIGPEI
jgi:hypothetical protein